MDGIADLRWLKELPVQTEPVYKEGFDCDVCAKAFFDGPFYHSVSTGRDCCIRCAEMLGIHPIPGLICDLFTPLSPNLMLRCANISTDEPIVVPLFSYIPEDTSQVGLYLSDESSLLVVVTDFALERGVHFKNGSSTLYDGELLVQRFPWLPSWCDLERLTSRSTRPLFHHAALGVRSEANQVKTPNAHAPALLRRVDHTQPHLLFFFFDNNVVQVFDSSRELELVVQQMPQSILLRCRIGKRFLTQQSIALLDQQTRQRIEELLRFSL